MGRIPETKGQHEMCTFDYSGAHHMKMCSWVAVNVSHGCSPSWFGQWVLSLYWSSLSAYAGGQQALGDSPIPASSANAKSQAHTTPALTVCWILNPVHQTCATSMLPTEQSFQLRLEF